MEVIRTFWNEYLVRLDKLRVTDFIEILILAVIIYYFLKWIKTTNAWAVLKGLTTLLMCWLIAYIFDFHAILWFFANAIGVGITAIIILFQPELRKVLEQLGKKDIMSPFFGPSNEGREVLQQEDVDELIRGVYALAKEKTGALIVIEQQIDLGKIIETGIALDSVISSGLLISIFEDKKPLHDGAVIIRGRRIAAATCYLPLSENMQLSKDMGTRHRAGVGISETADCFTIIVSEESGKVSIAKAGEIIRGVSGDFLKEQLNAMCKTGDRKKGWFLMSNKRKSKD
ncbi:MAG: diadenylate cyclase CdaA [Lachnospiraceae bacterium]|nr:diadenylate cyclase CdaA [Lachnospiraceae bacterium]